MFTKRFAPRGQSIIIKHGVKIWANFRKFLRLVAVVDMQLVQAFFFKNMGVHHHDVM